MSCQIALKPVRRSLYRLTASSTANAHWFLAALVNQFAFKQSYPISHPLSFSLPYLSNPAETTHVQRSLSL
jgi:hypothetical protein